MMRPSLLCTNLRPDFEPREFERAFRFGKYRPEEKGESLLIGVVGIPPNYGIPGLGWSIYNTFITYWLRHLHPATSSFIAHSTTLNLTHSGYPHLK